MGVGQESPHRDYLFLILKGGIIYLVMSYGIILFSIIRLIPYKFHGLHFIYAILLFLTMGYGHSMWYKPIPVIFVWLSVSAALNVSKSSNYQESINRGYYRYNNDYSRKLQLS